MYSVSTVITILVLFSIFTVHTGLISTSFVILPLLALSSAMLFRYTTIYHKVSRFQYRIYLLVTLAISFLLSTLISIIGIFHRISVSKVHDILEQESFGAGSSAFLADWWIGIILIISGIIVFIGLFSSNESTPYPVPNKIRTTAISPVYFGSICSFFGLWAVLFAGLPVQRAIIIAPIFEELIKFGVALLVGSTLFGRSMTARIGTSLVVGSLFGIIEHSTTYPTESYTYYLSRTFFHSATTTLSVISYTIFESQSRLRLQWIAPFYSMSVHFINNVFSVLAYTISILISGSQNEFFSVALSIIINSIIVILIICSIFFTDKFIKIHRPVEQFFSDFI